MAGRKKLKRNKTACYNENTALRSLLVSKEKTINRLKKQISRNKKVYAGSALSPNTKVQAYIGKIKISKVVRRKLILHEAIVTSLKDSAKGKSSTKERKRLGQSLIAAHSILKKYRMQGTMLKTFGLSKKQLANNKKKEVKSPMTEKVQAFFLDDEQSRIANGKKLTITRNKVKMQKRFLNDTMHILHKQFLQEHQLLKLSYVSFTRLRPFWVLPPSEKDRDTCLCKACENPRLLVEKLVNMAILKEIKHL